MIVYGFAKNYAYEGDGTLKIQVRIPSIHGPYKQQVTKAPYTKDEDLPWVTSLLTVNLPVEGDVVMLQSINESKSSDFVALGLTGGNYFNGTKLKGENYVI